MSRKSDNKLTNTVLIRGYMWKIAILLFAKTKYKYLKCLTITLKKQLEIVNFLCLVWKFNVLSNMQFISPHNLVQFRDFN